MRDPLRVTLTAPVGVLWWAKLLPVSTPAPDALSSTTVPGPFLLDGAHLPLWPGDAVIERLGSLAQSARPIRWRVTVRVGDALHRAFFSDEAITAMLGDAAPSAPHLAGAEAAARFLSEARQGRLTLANTEV